MSGLTNKELENLAKKLLGKQFLGFYTSDSRPKIKNLQNNSLIFNLSKHNEPGTHYVSVLFANKKIFYFDSFGKRLTNKHILAFLKLYNFPIFYHTKKIQANDSNFCSFFSLGFLYAIQKKSLKPFQFFKMFPTVPSKNNDKIVTTFLFQKKEK